MGKPLRPSPAAHTVPVVIPRGHDHFWSVIRELDKAGDWSAGDVVSRSNGHDANVHDFVGRLRKAGIAQRVGTERIPRYRLARSPAATPRLRRDGTEAPPSMQQHMWTAMRRLDRFTFEDLAYYASTDQVTVGHVTANTYIARLAAAGYLVAVVPGRPGKPAVWQIKLSMKTGRPKAPRVLRSHLVYDPNIDAVVGEAVAEEVEP